jgi:hypothetical protein
MADFGQTTSLEKSSLEAHVDLCAMRYQALDLRLANLEIKMDKLQEDVVGGNKSMRSTIIGAAATIVSSVLGLIVVMLM